MPSRFAAQPESTVRHPEWVKDATIYQVNVRHFTDEGTFAAAAEHLPRLADLGVRILWLMPVHEIGEMNRKGSLGSPYAVRDYYSVNADLGTMDDLTAYVARAHELGMYVILDWVANHTAWDCTLVAEHPDWYVRDWKGAYRPTPWWDWDDIIDLDYTKTEVREYVAEAMCFWVREADVDGFRCDVAGFVPTDFWVAARAALEEIKPVFMLAEWEDRELHRGAFDMTYGWSWNENLHHIATGQGSLASMHVFHSWHEKAYPRDAIRMLFLSNHDHNSWEGTPYERFGPAVEAGMVLSVVSEGMPLIYTGQEAGLDRRLKFFDKDVVEWREHPHGDLYRRLVALKTACPPLWNGAWGDRMIEVPSDRHDQVFAFVRGGAGDEGSGEGSGVGDHGDKVFAAFNLSGQDVRVTFGDAVREESPEVHGLHHGSYVDLASASPEEVGPEYAIDLPAWGWKVLVAGAGTGAITSPIGTPGTDEAGA